MLGNEAAAEPAVAAVESGDSISVSVDSVQAELVGPLEADAYFEAISAPEPSSITAEGEGEFPSLPPVLLTFTAVRYGPYWLLSGRVVDDMNPSNCRVYFDGILEGESTGVMPDGSFMYYVPNAPGMYEFINAIAKDVNGNVSNSMSVLLSA